MAATEEAVAVTEEAVVVRERDMLIARGFLIKRTRVNRSSTSSTSLILSD